MGEKMLRKTAKYWPVFVLVGLELALFWQNYVPGTFFLGWDNLFPEFNFYANLKRSLFAVWQEYRGLGLLDGMSFAANIVHYVFIWLLSFILPINLLRYFFFFLMHLLGGLGVYKLLNSYLKKAKAISLIGALFYQYNIGTVQMFYAPYELFAVHFAFLPWLVLYALLFLYNGGRKNLLLFALFTFFATPQAHVPTVFIVSLFALVIILAFYFLDKKRLAVKKSLLLFLIFFGINVFWIFPFAYNTLTNSNSVVNSKINMMSTQEIFLKNKLFGGLKQLAQVKGYQFGGKNILADGTVEYMLMPWQAYVKQPFFKIFAYSFFLLAIVGMVKSVREKDRKYYPFISMFLLAFLMLGLKLPIVSILTNYIFDRFALLKQIFRFTFTKFGTLYFFSLTIFLAVGAGFLVEHFKKEKTIVFLLCLSLFAYSFPSFQGYFLYPRLKVKVPQEYFKAVEFFKKQEESARMALLPQPSFWGWTQNDWGYKGSGFIWYGLPQAVMDGAFYPWSRNNENYYWELTRAINKNDVDLFQTVLRKYNISWVILDRSVIYKESSGAIDYERVTRLLEESSAVVFKKNFGKIFVYKVNLEKEVDKFVYLARGLAEINSYKWGDYDRAYFEYGDYYTRLAPGRTAFARKPFNAGTGKDKNNYAESLYKNYCSKKSNCKIVHKFILPTLRDKDQLIAQQIKVPTKPKLITDSLLLSISETSGVTTEPAKNTWPALSKIFDIRSNSFEEKNDSLGNDFDRKLNFILNNNIIYYPFRSLFSGRGFKDLRFRIYDSGENGDYFVFETQIPKGLVGGELIFPAIDKEEVSERERGDVVKRKFKLPEVYLDKELLPLENKRIKLSYIDKGNFVARVAKIGGYYSYDSGDLSGRQLKDIYLPNLKNSIAYLIGVKSENISGRPLKFWVENLTSKRSDTEVFLEKRNEPHWEYFILPPMARDGIGYSLHFDNSPIGDEKRVNKLERVMVNPIPYKFLTGIKIDSGFRIQDSGINLQKKNYIEVEHLNPSFYEVRFNNATVESAFGGDNITLVLSQAYDKGWKAYWIHDSRFRIYEWFNKVFPFIFGEPVGTPSTGSGSRHVLVNNWANGWNLKSGELKVENGELVIVYLPQYLQYFGFFLLFAVIIYLKKAARVDVSK
jgi:hypothetical protein